MQHFVLENSSISMTLHVCIVLDGLLSYLLG